MLVHLLGTAAGGGFPQWNCHCDNCCVVRSGTASARPRTQSCVAISSDGRRWFLVNASPDVRLQIESFAPLRESKTVRGTALEGVLLTNADLDHTLGLLMLREGERLTVHATAAVRRVLTEGLLVNEVLHSYCGIDWREPPTKLAPLRHDDGSPSGLWYAAFAVAGEPPRYWQSQVESSGGLCVGYYLLDERVEHAGIEVGWDGLEFSL